MALSNILDQQVQNAAQAAMMNPPSASTLFKETALMGVMGLVYKDIAIATKAGIHEADQVLNKSAPQVSAPESVPMVEATQPQTPVIQPTLENTKQAPEDKPASDELPLDGKGWVLIASTLRDIEKNTKLMHDELVKLTKPKTDAMTKITDTLGLTDSTGAQGVPGAANEDNGGTLIQGAEREAKSAEKAMKTKPLTKWGKIKNFGKGVGKRLGRYGKLGKFDKGLGFLGAALTVGSTVSDVVDTENGKDDIISEIKAHEDAGQITHEEAEKEIAKTEADTNVNVGGDIGSGAGTMAGALAGGEIGASAGAAIGSIIPFAGTAVGGVVGGLAGGAIGAFAGSSAGQWVGKEAGKGFNLVSSWFQNPETALDEKPKSKPLSKKEEDELEQRDPAMYGRYVEAKKEIGKELAELQANKSGRVEPDMEDITSTAPLASAQAVDKLGIKIPGVTAPTPSSLSETATAPDQVGMMAQPELAKAVHNTAVEAPKSTPSGSPFSGVPQQSSNQQNSTTIVAPTTVHNTTNVTPPVQLNPRNLEPSLNNYLITGW